METPWHLRNRLGNPMTRESYDLGRPILGQQRHVQGGLAVDSHWPMEYYTKGSGDRRIPNVLRSCNAEVDLGPTYSKSHTIPPQCLSWWAY